MQQNSQGNSNWVNHAYTTKFLVINWGYKSSNCLKHTWTKMFNSAWLPVKLREAQPRGEGIWPSLASTLVQVAESLWSLRIVDAVAGCDNLRSHKSLWHTISGSFANAHPPNRANIDASTETKLDANLRHGELGDVAEPLVGHSSPAIWEEEHDAGKCPKQVVPH